LASSPEVGLLVFDGLGHSYKFPGSASKRKYEIALSAELPPDYHRIVKDIYIYN
jgi:hypothetical protein